MSKFSTWTFSWRTGMIMVLLGIVEVAVLGRDVPFDLMQIGFVLLTAAALGPMMVEHGKTVYSVYNRRKLEADAQ